MGFNTQPPEGGWLSETVYGKSILSFNTQPPEGGWQVIDIFLQTAQMFQHTAA